ncbi:hypothetical protein GmHk_20G057387 [Glycine max]|nr:hypothetical protein GmHk_20G057387 [Glycine max]
MFIDWLRPQTKQLLDASTRGKIKLKTPEEATELIENMSASGSTGQAVVEKSSNSFGANTEKNPKEECKVVLTRSRKLVAAEDEDVVALKEQVALKDTTVKKKNGVTDEKIPSKKDKERHLARFLDIFKKLEMTMPFGEALQQMPLYSKFLKDMLTRKHKRFHSLDAWNRYTDKILSRNILSERNVQIYHTEFDEFKVELERHNLHKRLINLQDGSIDVTMVKEFYANLYTIEEQASKQARVRGHLIK